MTPTTSAPAHERKAPVLTRDARVQRTPVRGAPGRSTFYLLIALLVVLDLTGVVMVLSASSVGSIQQYGTPWHYFERQLIWLLVGGAAFVVALRTDRRRWRRLARPAMVVAAVMLMAVLAPGLGDSANGATRWIGPSMVQFQPSELAKLCLILFGADVMDRRADQGRDGRWLYQMGPVIAVFVGLAALVVMQPDMGTTVVLGLITLALLFTAGIPVRPLLGLLGTGAAGGMLLAVAAPYRWRRITSFLHPLKQASNAGFQETQGLVALAHGQVAGDGIGASIASWGYLPNAPTDFIFAVIGEETGLVGTVLLSGLFFAVGVVGVRIACGARDRYSGLVAAGITAWLVGQAFVNIGAVVGLLPVTGVPLPFVSYGGSSLVIELFGAGMLANIALRP
jgi:cell division protein FtsW